MEVVLVRHAQPHWEPDGRAVDDPPLTEHGQRQAECLPKALGGEHFDVLYTSTARRAIETAAPLAEHFGCVPVRLEWLHEIRLPKLEGKTSEEVQRYFGEARARALPAWWDGLPGGESFRHFYERVSGGVEALLGDKHEAHVHEDVVHRLWHIDDADATRILIVAHEGTNAVLLSHLLGIEPVPWAWMRFSSAWAGISRIHSLHIAGSAVWSLESFNQTEHLAGLDAESDGRARAVHKTAAEGGSS